MPKLGADSATQLDTLVEFLNLGGISAAVDRCRAQFRPRSWHAKAMPRPAKELPRQCQGHARDLPRTYQGPAEPPAKAHAKVLLGTCQGHAKGHAKFMLVACSWHGPLHGPGKALPSWHGPGDIRPGLYQIWALRPELARHQPALQEWARPSL